MDYGWEKIICPRNFFVSYGLNEKASVRIHYIVLEKPARSVCVCGYPVGSCPYVFAQSYCSNYSTARCQRFYHPWYQNVAKVHKEYTLL